MSLTIGEFIEVLETFPKDSEIQITNADGGFDGDFLLGVFHESEHDYESCTGFDVVGLAILKPYMWDYDWLTHDHEWEIPVDDKVWYNTKDYIETSNRGKSIKLYFNKETKKFEELRF